ncbi:MAG: DUF5711 family protein [Lachnospiraceae bacterium]
MMAEVVYRFWKEHGYQMSNIREYERKKENDKNNDFRKKIIQHRFRVLYRTALVLLLIAGIALLLYVQMKNRIYTDYQVVSSVERNHAENTTCMNYNGNILTYSKDGANCSDVKGTVLWNQTYEMQAPMVTINKNIVAMADYNGRTIYIMNQTGMLGEIETGMPIRSISVSESGIVAAVLDDASVNAIYLYDTAGETIAYFKTTMRKSGYPLAVAISDNSEVVAVSYLYADSGLITSNVAFYNFGSVGQNEGDRYVSGYSYEDAVVPELGFMNNTTSFAVADNRLVLYKGKEIPKSNAEVLLEHEVQSVYYNENYIGLVYMNTDGKSKYAMDIYDTAGKLIHTQLFDLDYTDIYFNEDCIVIYNDTECAIYNLKGIEKYKGNFKNAITLLMPTKQNYRYTAVTSDAIKEIELK